MTTAMLDPSVASQFSSRFEAIHRMVSQVVRGKDGELRLALVCMLAEGHLLIEDVPGTGKTTLAKSLAAALGSSMRRIQFTPDLLPTDVTGSTVYSMETGQFRFHPGAVFANVVLADEINRASPKTQSALLEVMEERQVTVDGTNHRVPRPFVVVATQNPVEFDGTYHLPEAQIDRFMMRMSLGYPSPDAEVDVIGNHLRGVASHSIAPVVDPQSFGAMIDATSRVHVAPALQAYAVAIAGATRSMSVLRLGVSPRGSLALVRAGQALAISNGRTFVTADDVRELAPFVLAHRMLLTPEAELQGQSTVELVHQVLNMVPIPEVRA